VADVTIVIVSFNTKNELDACLASLASAPPAARHDIVVVDNASSDGTPAVLRQRWPGVRLIEAGRNLGFAGANNLGIAAASSEFVLLLNSDTVVPAGAIDTLIGALASDPEAAAAGPRLVDASGRVELSFGAMISPFAELRQKIILRLYERRLPAAVRYLDRRTSVRHHPDWVSGACLLVRRADAVAAGLLDDRYFLYAEDVDFCAALRANGRRILFTPETQVVHLKGASGRRRPAETQRAYRRSQLAFYAKHHPRWAPVLRAYLWIRGRLPPPVPR
jgi:hypothetical protein